MSTNTHRRSLRSAFLLALGVALAACSDQTTAPPQSATRSVLRADATATLLPMVQWTTPLADSITSTQTVGILGGTISAGGISLIIPPLALTQPTQIRMTVPAGAYVSVRLQPHGLTFDAPPLLLFPTLGTNAGLLGVTNLIGVYTTTEPVNGFISVDEAYSMSVLGSLLGFHIRHFSDYAPADSSGCSGGCSRGVILMGG